MGSKLDISARVRIYNTDKNSVIFQGYVIDRFSTLRQWCFTSINFNQNLLVAPTFVKQRKLTWTPDIMTYCTFYNFQVSLKGFLLLNVLTPVFSDLSGISSNFISAVKHLFYVLLTMPFRGRLISNLFVFYNIISIKF